MAGRENRPGAGQPSVSVSIDRSPANTGALGQRWRSARYCIGLLVVIEIADRTFSQPGNLLARYQPPIAPLRRRSARLIGLWRGEYDPIAFLCIGFGDDPNFLLWRKRPARARPAIQ